MALTFTTTGQASAIHGVKVLIYADSGIGKTVLTATAPSPILLSAESGVLSLRKKNLERLFGVNNPHICYDIPTIQIKTVDDLTEAYTWLTQSAEANQFQTVCLDSITEIGEVVLNNAKRQVKDPRQAYGELIEKMESVIRYYRDIQGKHVYMAAKSGTVKDDLTGLTKTGPSMPGSKLGQALPYYFDEVLRLAVNTDPQTQQSYRYLQTQPDFQNIAKDRSGCLDVMEMPNLTNLFNKILGDQ